ncbi:Saccharopine dehydrogenase-domain-containing protein [Coniochaeta sp. 2T2.1]|nr:Saccharopine dehydrogenase-domain-containing protein [Coniochaeta sp. 2T2.1]
MPIKKHDREYDLVVFGATGYTGKFTAESITTHLPTDLKWAVAGRSTEKLNQVVAHCKTLNPDRRQPAIEVCNLDHGDLDTLSKKTVVLISTVGPFGKFGEFAFKACAENGTHYVDVTGEVPFVARMIKKYEATAKASGALMFPQCGVESSPADLLTWSLANAVREKFNAPVGDVTLSLHKLNSAPSGGTLASALGLLDHFTAREIRASHVPFALSPVPNSSPRHPPRSLLSRLTGLVTVPNLGLQTTCIAGATDAAIVERTWGLLRSNPRTAKDQAYGQNFSYREYMRPRNWFHGLLVHYGLMALFFIVVTPPLKALVRRFVYKPGEGPDVDVARGDEIEFRGIAEPDVEAGTKVGERAWSRCWYAGSMYYLSGLLLAQAAATILEEDLQLEGGGIYTPACLGQGFIDRLDGAGFHFETKIVPT